MQTNNFPDNLCKICGLWGMMSRLFKKQEMLDYLMSGMLTIAGK
jgi:hypothetical protein